MTTDFVLDALEQALYARQPCDDGALIHHSDRRRKQSAEVATLEWAAWYNHHRLTKPLGYIPPAEAGENYYRKLKNAVGDLH